MAEVVYVLCALTSLGCAALLVRSYFSTRTRLLLWSSIGFLGLAASNVLLYLDLVIFPDVYLLPWRMGTTLAGLLALLYGLTREGL
jgi:hypothetical protein